MPARSAGCCGSRYFADHPTVPTEQIVAQLNIDMIGRNRDDKAEESNTVYLVGSDRISSELHDINREANRALPTPLTLDYEMNDPADLEQVYYRSDHYSYAAKGIPIIFFTTGLHADYHANTDEVSKIEFDKMARIAQLVYETGLRRREPRSRAGPGQQGTACAGRNGRKGRKGRRQEAPEAGRALAPLEIVSPPSGVEMRRALDGMRGLGGAAQSNRGRAISASRRACYPPGPLNAITDVAGVRVGHTTLVRGDQVRTGVTAILPHGGNLFQDKVAGAVFVGNAFGKLAGSTQVNELGTIETPIVLTNTLGVGVAIDAVVRYTLAQPGNEQVRSVNALVGETNDGGLNDIRALPVTTADVLGAIRSATGGPVAEGSVGAGTGTVCFGWKCGIGTSSRRVPAGYVVGVLAQTNFGGNLTIGGVPIWRSLQPPRAAARRLPATVRACSSWRPTRRSTRAI